MAKLVPRSPRNVICVLIVRFLPKSSKEGVKVVTNFVGDAKGGHGISRHGLGY